MPDPNGWPDKPGVPLNPELDGWHWIEPKLGPKAMWPAYWCASNGGYWNWQSDDASDRQDYAAHMRDGSWKYRGPCLLPAEVAARVAEALDEAAAVVAAGKEVPRFDGGALTHTEVEDMTGEEAAAAIRGLKVQSHDR